MSVTLRAVAAENIRCADGVTGLKKKKFVLGCALCLEKMCTESKSFYLLFTLFKFISYQLCPTVEERGTQMALKEP